MGNHIGLFVLNAQLRSVVNQTYMHGVIFWITVNNFSKYTLPFFSIVNRITKIYTLAPSKEMITLIYLSIK